MLRFCPGEKTLRDSRQFTCTEGGGEYNVARALSHCFQVPSRVATSLVDNEVGQLVHQMILTAGVDTQHIVWRDFDGIGKEVRNPLYFAERGFGYRNPKAAMDRGHSAPSQLKVGDFNWDDIFSGGEIKWFHTGGIFAGLSETTAELAKEAMQSAKKHGVHVSYDPNFRGSLWQARGGVAAAAELNRELAAFADTLFGVAPLLHAEAPPKDLDGLCQLIEETVAAYPQVQTVALGRRHIQSASLHDYAASVWHGGEFHHIDGFKNIPVLDRIGSGDAFAAGFIAGSFDGLSPADSARQGAATSALTMSTPGDSVLCSKAEVQNLAVNQSPSESR